MLATGPGKPPAVWVWTSKTVRFSSRKVYTPVLLLLGGPNEAQYLSTNGFRWDWLDLPGPIPGFALRVVLFMVAFRYRTVNLNH